MEGGVHQGQLWVICYELLDELVDFGYPQTDAKILQEFITQG